MQSQTESAAIPPPTEASNDEFLPRRSQAVPSGWNAHEVWRTRIKAVHDARVALVLVARNE